MYRALLEKYPNDPVYTYLAANALVGFRTKEAIAQLEKMDFPWAHHALVEIYKAPAFKDKEKALQHIQALMKACPESLEPFTFLRDAEPSDFLGSGQDYARALQDGYKLLGDTESAKWAEQEVSKRAPAGSRGFYAYIAWSKANPSPKPDDPPERQATYYEAQRKASAEWIRQFPNDTFALEQRVRALRQAENVEAAEVAAAGEALLRLKDKQPGPDIPLSGAELYASKGVRTDQVPALVREAIQELQKPRAYFSSDLYARTYDRSTSTSRASSEAGAPSPRSGSS